jgi:hypothetical protein
MAACASSELAELGTFLALANRFGFRACAGVSSKRIPSRRSCRRLPQIGVPKRRPPTRESQSDRQRSSRSTYTSALGPWRVPNQHRVHTSILRAHARRGRSHDGPSSLSARRDQPEETSGPARGCGRGPGRALSGRSLLPAGVGVQVCSELRARLGGCGLRMKTGAS